MDVGIDLSAWAESGWIGVLVALALNTLAILATWRVTRHILRRVDEVSESLKAIRRELEARGTQRPRV